MVNQATQWTMSRDECVGNYYYHALITELEDVQDILGSPTTDLQYWLNGKCGVRQGKMYLVQMPFSPDLVLIRLSTTIS